jgi:cleavage and polyadenylation specificity factor subunit 1
MGSVMQQRVYKAWQPLAFSKKLNPAQQKYSAYDREPLAVYEAVKHFRHMLEARHFIIFADHKPITYAFQQKRDKCSPRQFNHLDFIAQLTTDIRHIFEQDNAVADALSRVESVTAPPSHDALAASQDGDNELQTLLGSSTGLRLERQQIPGTMVSIYCDTSAGKPWPYVPASLRLQVFQSVHDLSHPGTKATAKLVVQRFVWPGMQKDCRTWARVCQACQRSRVSRHTVTPTSAGYTYCLTAVDRFTRWPEAIPITDITADIVARALLTGWMSRFRCSQTITTDQGRHFESQLFHSLARLCGIQLSRTTTHHPAANGLVERFHRTMKAAIMCHAVQQWTEAIPLVLLGVRKSFKADLQASVANLVYGELLRIPVELLPPTADPVEPAHLITQLRRHMARLRTVPALRHASSATFMHKDLHNCTCVFLRQDATRRALEPSYSGPYQVLLQREKTLQLLVSGKPVTVSADRVKPAYILNEADCGSTIFNPLAISTPNTAPPPAIQTTHSSRHVRFPARLST